MANTWHNGRNFRDLNFERFLVGVRFHVIGQRRAAGEVFGTQFTTVGRQAGVGSQVDVQINSSLEFFGAHCAFQFGAVGFLVLAELESETKGNKFSQFSTVAPPSCPHPV
jgi:hypothetical protein